MGYAGQTYRVPFHNGGFNYSPNIDNIAPEDFVSPSRNVEYEEGGVASRGGTEKVNGTAVSGTPRIMGIFDFQLASSSFQVFFGKDGKLYKDTSTTIKTGLSTANYPSFDVFRNELYFCDGDTTPQTWDGSAAGTSNLTSPSADWSGGNQPFQVITHGRGESRRVWYLYSNAVYYSSLDNGKEVTGGTSGKITIDTGDAAGLVGGIVFGDRLFVFSRKKAFLIDDDDADLTNWGYSTVQWARGAAHWRLLIKTPNDLVVMTDDGDIYSVAAAQSYGDYTLASLTRPAFIDRYIRDSVNLAQIEQFHGLYDPVKRAVRIFVVKDSGSEVTAELRYYIDRTPQKAWAIEEGAADTSGYNASCSAFVRESAGTYRVWTGDYGGYLWKLDKTQKNDADNAYYSGISTPYLNFDDPRTRKHFRRGYIIAKAKGNWNVQVKISVDGTYKSTENVSLAGIGSVLGSFVLGTSTLGGDEIVAGRFDIGSTGKRIKFEVFNSALNQPFFLSEMHVDFKSLGRIP